MVCSCETKVLRVYSELRALGEADRRAFESALTLYRIRHPEAGPRAATDVVAAWISDSLGQ